MRDQKQSLREKAHLRREGFSASELASWNRAIEKKVLSLPAYLQSRSVALYSPIGNEVDTKGICDHALRNGKRVFYPKSRREEPALVRVQSCGCTQAKPDTIFEPLENGLMTEKDRERLVLFIPGLAFDLEGNRLGRGGGWYDRTLMGLGEKAERVALAYEFQVVKALPVEDWDQKVDQIITEARIIRCSNPAP